MSEPFLKAFEPEEKLNLSLNVCRDDRNTTNPYKN